VTLNFFSTRIKLGLVAILFFSLFSGNVSKWSEAHLTGQKIQVWEDKNDNIQIQFTFMPEKPIIDTFTELMFSIQNLSSGEHIENLTGRVVVTNGQRLFKFENISIPNGHFSVKYLFPDDGTHQVLLRLDRNNDVKMLSSFNVLVPHQSPPNILDPFVQPDKMYLTFTVVAIMLAAIALGILYFKRKK
jgi:hypothetical protein